MLSRRNAVLPLLAAAVGARAQLAANNRPILRVTGLIGPDHGPEGAGFDLPALEALGVSELETRTAWTGPRAVRFSGVALSKLLAAVAAHGRTMRAIALNDYMITAPVATLLRDDAFLATRQDGQPLRIRDRGPVWLVFPWSRRPDLDTTAVRERSIWQIRLIDIR